MNHSEEQNLSDKAPDSFRSSYLLMITASVLTLLGTFLISNSALEFPLKTAIFGALVAIYLIFCGGFYYFHNRPRDFEQPEIVEAQIESEDVFSPEVQEKLLVLEEANSFFATSLKSPDMFRLAANRIAELIPFATCVLFLADENKTKLTAVQAVGENAGDFLGVEMNSGQGLAGKTFLSRRAQLDENLSVDGTVIEESALKNLKTAIAVPLRRSAQKIYGVLALYNNQETFDLKTVRLLEEVALRVAPLFLNSLAFERNLESALTDTLTNLPNERAFYLVLENQIAESQRLGERRPLTVLSIDIKNFDEVNKKYGHPAGDRILTLTAKIIKGQLRQMDFLSRFVSDEFLAVLPTASEEITKVIIERVEKAFKLNPFEIDEREKIQVQLNFGAASFIKDGETAQELLKRAILKKQEAKSSLKSSVLWFSREYVN